MSARAWVLNLDVENELADPAGYTRSDAMARQLRAAAVRVKGLIGDHDVLVDDAAGAKTPKPAAGLQGDAWCPTPRALSTLRAAGAVVPEAPSLEVLRRVNDRAFAIAIDPGPLDSRYVSTIDAVRSAIDDVEQTWLLKRGLSFAGRGHLRVLGTLTDDDARWCDNAFRHGLGVVVEPLVQRQRDFVQHGWVTRRGETLLGRPLLQRCDARGGWQSTADLGAEDLQPEERTRLTTTADLVGSSLAAVGYFGPFGIDAFRYRDGDHSGFNPLVEINARYGMGWGLSGCRRDVP